MLKITTKKIDDLRRDLSLRGYPKDEVDGLLQRSLLIIPGQITRLDSNKPEQKLTNHQVFLFKDLQKEGIVSQVIEKRDTARVYVEERSAHIDLGTIIIPLSIMLGNTANIAQISDFLLNWIQFKLIRGRTQDLTPEVKFSLRVHNDDNQVSLEYEGPPDGLKEIQNMLTPSRLKAMLQDDQIDHD